MDRISFLQIETAVSYRDTHVPQCSILRWFEGLNDTYVDGFVAATLRTLTFLFFSPLFRLCVIQFGISHLERWHFSMGGSIYVAHHRLSAVPALHYHPHDQTAKYISILPRFFRGRAIRQRLGVSGP
jgi:hypothetical protein